MSNNPETPSMTMQSDLHIVSHGSVCLLHPKTPAAQDWFAEHFAGREEIQFWGGALVVEPRYVEDLAMAAVADGLTIH
jgi:hypothetical protein